MLDIVAGGRAGDHGLALDEVFDLASVPAHIVLVRDWALDDEPYAETELTDVELLGLAAEDAADAHAAGLLGGPGMDRVSLRRARRRAARRGVTSALRLAVGGVA